MTFKRRAILIGIQYANSDHELPEAHFYLRKFRTHLIQKLKWPAENIRCLLDQVELNSNRQPTKKNIRTEISKVLTKTKSGDITLIYYCGHGSIVRGSVDEILLPVDYQRQGGITGMSMHHLLEEKLIPGAKCWLIIDSASTGFRGGLGLKVIPRHLHLTPNLLIVDRHGQISAPVGILEMINEHEREIRGQLIILTCFQPKNEVIVYGLLTDYCIRRLSGSINITFATLLAQLGRDLLQPEITTQQPLLAISNNSQSILNHRLYNYI